MSDLKTLPRGKNKKIRSFFSRILESKRQKFIVSVLFLSLSLFLDEQLLGKSGLIIVFFLSLLTVLLMFYSLREDLKDNLSPQVFILPFFYSLSVGLFYLLIPARFLTRVGMTGLYALGLYSLFLTQNIFT